MFLEFFFIVLIAISITVLLLLRRKIYCIIAGLGYLISGGIAWLIKMIYICYLVFGGKVNESFDESAKIEAIPVHSMADITLYAKFEHEPQTAVYGDDLYQLLYL